MGHPRSGILRSHKKERSARPAAEPREQDAKRKEPGTKGHALWTPCLQDVRWREIQRDRKPGSGGPRLGGGECTWKLLRGSGASLRERKTLWSAMSVVVTARSETHQRPLNYAHLSGSFYAMWVLLQFKKKHISRVELL